jgi:two-component system response regulator HydG
MRNFIESMVVLDVDGVLNIDDVQEGNILNRIQPLSGQSPQASHLIGRPLSEVERFFIEQALSLTNGNREEASRMLGIGERTLYRVIQDWKLQDKIKKALAENFNDMEKAAKSLGMKSDSLIRKLKKLALTPDSEDDSLTRKTDIEDNDEV